MRSTSFKWSEEVVCLLRTYQMRYKWNATGIPPWTNDETRRAYLTWLSHTHHGLQYRSTLDEQRASVATRTSSRHPTIEEASETQNLFLRSMNIL